MTQPVDAAPKPQYTRKQGERMYQNVKAMAFSVLATVAIVALVVMLNPLRDRDADPGIDVPAIAAEASSVADFTALAPEIPEDWYASYARWNGSPSDGVPNWQVGYVTPDEEFVGFVQSSDANSTWVGQQVHGAAESGLIELSGHDFSVHRADNGHTYLVTELAHEEAAGSEASDIDSVTLVVSGSGSDEQITTLTKAVLENDNESRS
ncbi:DUF4245 domain-containing protein [Citricoccus muralis]|uniref:DUF4245 domain-containing protein n=1 Tax=Citricoccus muralis TaxID=169134 RepID=A0ABY8H8Z8_9MICC|nr:DUF4245 domain-containing protein [Citricoccus muralis]WFP17381.1 DUF4245 domain-containing protein [Citricoccus muralis]